VTKINAKGGRSYTVAGFEISDSDGNPTSGVTVTASYSGPSSGTTSGITDNHGMAVLESKAVKNAIDAWCFFILDLQGNGYIYNPNMNIVSSACDVQTTATSASIEGYIDGNQLSICYPNPFNNRTAIGFVQKEADLVMLQILNINGQLVDNLVNTLLEPGYHQYNWDASSLPSGYYIYHLRIGDQVETGKLYKY
jgi:hypothetical protein